MAKKTCAIFLNVVYQHFSSTCVKSSCCVMLALWGMTALEERAVSYCILTGLWSPFAFLMWSLHHTSLRSPDHGGVLCMISCWFSRHCFSLSSVSVSRCSKMETVCKINGQAQDGGAPGLPSARPAQLPRNKRHLFPPRLLLGALFLGFHACSCWLGKVVLCCLRAAEGHSEGQQAWWSDI